MTTFQWRVQGEIGEVFISCYTHGRNEVRWRPRQEASLTPPCSNLRSVRSKSTVLKKGLVTWLGRLSVPRSHSAPPYWFGAPGNCAHSPPRYTPGYTGRDHKKKHLLSHSSYWLKARSS